MAESPLTTAEGPLRLSISSNGVAQRELPVISVTVRHGFNTIPWARLVIADGDMPTQTLPVSDGELFAPGASVVIQAGYGNGEATIFSGIVVRHGFEISGANVSRLIVECRSPACRMTLGQHTAHHLDQSDSTVIETLIADAGLSAVVAETGIVHRELVQYQCSDWDFMLARADAMGLLVNVQGSQVKVAPPEVSAAPVLKLAWGVDLIDFAADIDALSQWHEVQASSWNPATQALEQSQAVPSMPLNDQGNLDGASLAAVASPDIIHLQTCAPQTRAVLDAWAQAQQRKAAMARVRGRMSFQGSALARPGALVELEGVGQRFSGKALLSAVEHQISDGGWTSQAEFGLDPHWHVQRRELPAAPNGGLLPGVTGLQIGVVLRLDGDPEGEGRIQVRLAAQQAATDGIWARPMQFQASQGFGSLFLPEVGDEVLLGHLNGDPAHPVVLGSLYSSKRAAPYALEAGNNTRAIVTRCRHRIEFNDADKIITLTTPAGNRIVMSDQDRSLVVQDQNGNTVQLGESGIALDSPKDIRLSAQGSITLDAVQGVAINSNGDLKLAGLNIEANAQAGFQARGAASAELSASGQTTIQGALVMIN